MKFFLLLFTLSLTFTAQAKINVLFHPKDPTLETIAQWISEADEEINIAMYNMETSDKSPVIKAIKSEAVQNKINSGELVIRVIFEGYGTPEENKQKMKALEDMGLDVRFLGKPKKIHHKFGVFDPASKKARVVTGSANWSLSSYNNYNENILFFENESEATARFQTEFYNLWEASKEFGHTIEGDSSTSDTVFKTQKDLEVFFNYEETVLTSEVVRLIESAQSELQIATTRVRLQPVLEALYEAAERGVNIQIVISQDDYQDLNKRLEFLTHENIELRIKFYNLRPSEYMNFQMHNKFMIVDGKTILTGSFNWSTSSEKNHIENLIELSGKSAAEVMEDYQTTFAEIWDLGREEFPGLKKSWEKLKANGEKPACAFEPTTLEISELKEILKNFRQCR